MATTDTDALIRDLTGALNFIIAFYEPGQRYLDTEAWKHAEAGGRRALARGKAYLDWDGVSQFRTETAQHELNAVDSNVNETATDGA